MLKEIPTGRGRKKSQIEAQNAGRNEKKLKYNYGHECKYILTLWQW